MFICQDFYGRIFMILKNKFFEIFYNICDKVTAKWIKIVYNVVTKGFEARMRDKCLGPDNDTEGGLYGIFKRKDRYCYRRRKSDT